MKQKCDLCCDFTNSSGIELFERYQIEGIVDLCAACAKDVNAVVFIHEEKIREINNKMTLRRLGQFFRARLAKLRNLE